MRKGDYYAPLQKGEMLYAEHPEYLPFTVMIHGSVREWIKLSKRLVCALKHLPLRLQIDYVKDPRRSLDTGVGTGPTLMLGTSKLTEGLVSAEYTGEIFETELEKIQK